MKFAVYVEGQSELLFVADVLQKYSSYDSKLCGFLCINLTSNDFARMIFPQQGDETSENYYQIVNVNNDNLVVSKLRKNIPGLLNNGYNVMIGLKDVYGTTYEQMMNGEIRVDRTVIEEMHKAQYRFINAPECCDCRLHFAIMEYETWMLALIEHYVTSRGKNLEAVCEQLGIDMTHDYEQTLYHPYPVVKKIFQACGEDYRKHSSDLLSFLSTLTVNDYETLRCSGRCISFAKFLDSLLVGVKPTLP